MSRVGSTTSQGWNWKACIVRCFLIGLAVGLGASLGLLILGPILSNRLAEAQKQKTPPATVPQPAAMASPTLPLPPSPMATPTAPPSATPTHSPTSPPPTPTPPATPTALSPSATPTTAPTMPPPMGYPPTPIPYACGARAEELVLKMQPVTHEDEALAKAGVVVLCAIRDNRWDVVASYAHPDRGDLRFSPDVYLSPEDLSFPADLVPGLPTDNTVYTWGTMPGSGMPIRMTFREYVQAYVYDGPYWESAQPGLDVRRGAGTVPDNHATFYPGSRVVEFYLPPSEPGGLDWRSLRLVFVPLHPDTRTMWRLVAITHDAWTP
ncbi:MAG: hypothetical protein GXO36_02210 [Chloroflexi bacterium]|nr:hypothetical protein [Chloroflexota bacterium]